MNTIIQKFFEKQKIATICGVNHLNEPFVFSCFYVLQNDVLLFKSNANTGHVQSMFENKVVAGTVIQQSANTIRFSGAQFEGAFLGEAETNGISTTSYYTRHPFAVPIPGNVYAIQITSIKFTEHALGFMKKHYWSGNVEATNNES